MKSQHTCALQELPNGFNLTAMTQDQMLSSDSAKREVFILDSLDMFLRAMRGKKITLSALHILLALYRSKEMTARPNMLAKEVGVTCAGVTGVADVLVRKGLAVRQCDPKDRRAILLNLTLKGVRLVESIETSLSASMRNSCCGPAHLD